MVLWCGTSASLLMAVPMVRRSRCPCAAVCCSWPPVILDINSGHRATPEISMPLRGAVKCHYIPLARRPRSTCSAPQSVAWLCSPRPLTFVQVGIYFPLYDALAAELARGPAGAYAPLVAGAAARTAAVLCTSPLELVRTRMQVGFAAAWGNATKDTYSSVDRKGTCGFRGVILYNVVHLPPLELVRTPQVAPPLPGFVVKSTHTSFEPAGDLRP